MEQAVQGLTAQLVKSLAPMVVSAVVVVVVFTIALAKVHNRAIRQFSGYAAMLVWLGWLANHYNVV